MAARALWLRGLLALTLAAAGWTTRGDELAVAEVEASLARALSAYALARALDGVVSMAQGTELAFEPIGIGVTLAPGELLHPVQDLIEHFSGMMLLASTALGLQRVLLGITTWTPLVVALTVALLAWWAAYATRRMRLERALRALALVLLALRFATPLAALASEAAYRVFLEPQFLEARLALETAHKNIGGAARAVTETPSTADRTWLERAQDLAARAGRAFEVRQRIEALERAASDAARRMVELMVLFLLQCVLFPLAFLWLAWRATTQWLPVLVAGVLDPPTVVPTKEPASSP